MGENSVWICRSDGSEMHRLTDESYSAISRPQFRKGSFAVLYSANLLGSGPIPSTGIWSIYGSNSVNLLDYIHSNLMFDAQEQLSIYLPMAGGR